MSGMTRAALDAIRERVEAATEGPWHSHDFGHAGEEEPSSIVVHVGGFDHSDLLTYDTETAVAWMPRWERQESDNATFIAHARTDVPDLLAEVERLRAGIEALIVEYGGERDLMDPDYYYALSIASSDLAALLNPTEGETNE